MQNDITHLTENVHALHDVVKLQEENVNTLLMAMQLAQTNHAALEKRMEDSEPKVKELWEKRTEAKGVSALLTGLGGFIVGGAVVAGFIYSIMTKHSP